MGEDLFYTMNRSKLGTAVIINNLDQEQMPTRRDVEVMGKVLRDIGRMLLMKNKSNAMKIRI